MHVRKRVVVAIASLAAVLLASSGCESAALSSDTATNQTLKIGFIASLSGTYQAAGTDMRDGFQLYVETHGNKLGGRDVQLLVADEGDGPQTALPAANRLVKDEKVVALAGVVAGGTYKAIADLATASKLPLIGSNGRPAMTDLTWLWHTSFLSAECGQAIASYVKENVDGPVYVIGPDYQGGYDQINGFVDAFTKAGGKLANPDGKPTYTPFPNTSNFIPYLNQIAASGAKAVYAFYAGSNAIAFVKQRAQSGAKDIPLYGSFLTEGLLQPQGDAAIGILNVSNYSPDLRNPANNTFVAAWSTAHRDRLPTTFAMSSWDAAAVLDRAIGAITGEVTSERINEELGRLGQIDSPRGGWEFSSKTHSPVQPWYLRTVKRDGPQLSNVVVTDLGTIGG